MKAPDVDEPRAYLLDRLERCITGEFHHSPVNLWVSAVANELKALEEEGIFKRVMVGKVPVGYNYKEHLITICDDQHGDPFFHDRGKM